MTTSQTLQVKVAFIQGGSRGIGAAIAEKLAAEQKAAAEKLAAEQKLAAEKGIKHGDTVKVTTKRGYITAKAVVTWLKPASKLRGSTLRMTSSAVLCR